MLENTNMNAETVENLENKFSEQQKVFQQLQEKIENEAKSDRNRLLLKIEEHQEKISNYQAQLENVANLQTIGSLEI